MSTDTPKVYVGTYAKYNNGSIQGAWIDLEGHDEESFYKACKELHSDESDPEYMFQDFENFPKSFYGESSLDSRVFEWLELDEYDRNKVEAFLDCFGDCAGDVFEAANDSCHGTADSDLDFAYEYIDSTGMLADVPESIQSYFDYEKFSRDLMMDFSSSNGFYFSSNW
jgi:antirestriction protein